MAGHEKFEKLVADAKKNVTEISPSEAAEKAKSGEAVITGTPAPRDPGDLSYRRLVTKHDQRLY